MFLILFYFTLKMLLVMVLIVLVAFLILQWFTYIFDVGSSNKECW